MIRALEGTALFVVTLIWPIAVPLTITYVWTGTDMNRSLGRSLGVVLGGTLGGMLTLAALIALIR